MTWPLKPAEKGKVAVAKRRGGPIQISYEIHGTGPMKLVVGLQFLLTVLIDRKESCVVLCRMFKNFVSSSSTSSQYNVLCQMLTSFVVDYGLSRFQDIVATAD